MKGGGLATLFQVPGNRTCHLLQHKQLLELNNFSAMLYVAGTKYRNFMQGLGGGPVHEPIHIPQTFSRQASPLHQGTRGVREKSSHLSQWKHKVSCIVF